MKISQGSLGRIFVIRLEDGDTLPGSLEEFARDNGVKAAYLALLGGADEGSKLVVGPRDGKAYPPDPMVRALPGVSEALAVGTLFPNEKGESVLHMHGAMGRDDKTVTGCVRAGVDIWTVGEVVVFEILDTDMVRKVDPKTGFELLTNG